MTTAAVSMSWRHESLHADICAIAQDNLWVTLVTEWLQRQGMHWARSCHRQSTEAIASGAARTWCAQKWQTATTAPRPVNGLPSLPSE